MRAGEGEVFIDLVGEEPQVALATNFSDAGYFLGGKDDAGRVVRAVDPDDAGARCYRLRYRVEVGMEAAIRPQRDHDEPGAAGADDPTVGGVNRLRHYDFVAGAGEALQSAEEAPLSARGHDHILGTARLPGAILESRGNRCANTRKSDGCRITGAMPAQRLDRCLDDWKRRLLVGIAHSQKNYVPTHVAQP